MMRDQVEQQEISNAFELLRQGLNKRIQKHGNGKFASRAEALGILCEEYAETIEAMRRNVKQEFVDEMMDVAVTALWAIISLANTKSDLK